MRTYEYTKIMDWLLGIHLNSDDPIAKHLAGEAIDLIKDQKKWLNRSHDMRSVYTHAYELGKADGQKKTAT